MGACWAVASAMREVEGLVWVAHLFATMAMVIWGTIYCLYLLWRGQARGSHVVLLAACCFFIPKMPMLMARGGISQEERLTYSGLVSIPLLHNDKYSDPSIQLKVSAFYVN